MCFLQERQGLGLQYSIKFGWTPKLPGFKYPGHIPFKRMLLYQWNMHYISYHCCYSPEFSKALRMNLLLETGTLHWKLMECLFWSLKEMTTHMKVKHLWSSIRGLIVKGHESALPQAWTVCALPDAVHQSICSIQNSHGEQDGTATSVLMSSVIFHVARITYFFFN